MIKCTLFLTALFFATQQLSAQCPVTLNCPSASPQVCDETNNSPEFWNNTYWSDAVTGSHDLPDATVNLSVTATDDCSNGVFTFKYLLFLDLDGDGSQETVVSSDNLPPNGEVHYNNVNNPNYSGGTSQVFDQRNIPAVFKYRFTMQTLVKGGKTGIARLRWQDKGFDNYVLPQLPYGTHRIKWTVINSAGNQAECEYIFTIKECVQPTVICLEGLSVNILPNGVITLWATDFIQYATDNYSPANTMQYAITKNDLNTFPTNALGNPIELTQLTCADVGTTVPLWIWVKDAFGNVNYCETSILVEDEDGYCDELANIYVCANTACGDIGIEDAQITVSVLPPGYPPLYMDLSNANGCGSMNTVPPGYVDFALVRAAKDDNYLNGVSSNDITLIMKHILGLEPFTEPWQFIAADVDGNGTIQTNDLIVLDELIDGVYSELPDNVSWRFYRSDYVFPPGGNPLQSPVPTAFTVAELLADPSLYFKGVKIGDVDCSAIPNGFGQNPSERAVQSSETTVIFTPQPNPTTAGLRIPVQLAQPEDIIVNISDLSGKLLWFNTLSLESGNQLLEIPASVFPVSGVYVWRVQAGEVVQSGKIVKTD